MTARPEPDSFPTVRGRQVHGGAFGKHEGDESDGRSSRGIQPLPGDPELSPEAARSLRAPMTTDAEWQRMGQAAAAYGTGAVAALVSASLLLSSSVKLTFTLMVLPTSAATTG